MVSAGLSRSSGGGGAEHLGCALRLAVDDVGEDDRDVVLAALVVGEADEGDEHVLAVAVEFRRRSRRR